METLLCTRHVFVLSSTRRIWQAVVDLCTGISETISTTLECHRIILTLKTRYILGKTKQILTYRTSRAQSSHLLIHHHHHHNHHHHHYEHVKLCPLPVQNVYHTSPRYYKEYFWSWPSRLTYISLNLLMLKSKYSRKTISMTWQETPWILASPRNRSPSF